MEIYILGAYGPWPSTEGGCSSYLIKASQGLIVIDCGSGALVELQKLGFKPWDVDAIVLSHLHRDHISDLGPWRYAIAYAVEKELRKTPLTVYSPAAPEAEFAGLDYKGYMLKQEINQSTYLTLAGINFSFTATEHPVPTLAVRAEGEGRIFVYSGDTSYKPQLQSFFATADIFLCEAGYTEEELKAGGKNHLSASQAATLAADAKVKKLVLTHLSPVRSNHILLEEAKKIFPNVQLAKPGKLHW